MWRTKDTDNSKCQYKTTRTKGNDIGTGHCKMRRIKDTDSGTCQYKRKDEYK